jgi:carboxymethylenebutenolidase
VDAVRVEFPSGADRIGGVLVAPGAGGPHPGIVVIPDVRGIYDHYHDVAQRIAARGYAVLVLDLYAREGAPELPSMDAVFRFMRALPDARVLADVQAAVDWLGARPETRGRRIGITGFCMGGKYALLAACSCRGLSAAVAWYGMLRVGEIDATNPEHPLDALARLGCPLLGLFGKEDPIVPLADVEELSRRAAALPHEVDVVVYPGAGHAFANDSRPEAYRPEAAADGWSRAWSFFRRHLG